MTGYQKLKKQNKILLEFINNLERTMKENDHVFISHIVENMITETKAKLWELERND